MAINNFGKKHLTEDQMKCFDEALDVLTEIVSEVSENLNNEERVRLSKIQEKRKLFANAVMDLHETQSDLSSPDVDWTEFKADFKDRKFADTRLDRLKAVSRMLSDFKLVHDYDNFYDSLADFNFTKYKSNTFATGYSEKLKYLKQFFAIKKKKG